MDVILKFRGPRVLHTIRVLREALGLDLAEAKLLTTLAPVYVGQVCYERFGIGLIEADLHELGVRLAAVGCDVEEES